SGSDRILKLMNRRYGRERFFDVADRLRKAVPGISITSDIIVGFPGEKEEDFSQTLDAMEKIRFDNVFSFVYSPRRGTPAAKMPDQIPDEVKKERMKRLLDLQQKICLEINSLYVDKTVTALCEGKSKNDPSMLSARSLTGKLIHFEGDEKNLEGKFVELEITKAMPIMLFAKLRENEK
ncbi:MAG: radical SAM protein, partial [Clostridia bacterium]|nr:radical SAM protein [Clostridia bacterium]